MDKSNINYRVKKYLFFISFIFVIVTTTHLIYSFIYSNSKEIAIKWWSVSEWLIGKVPSLNPLRNKTAEDQYVNSILYRSLLKYDVNTNKIVWDLAKCDIKNLLKITCLLNTNLKWSNWEDIIKEDIIKTYEIVRDSNTNPNISSLLKNVKIEKTNEWIVFHNSKKDIQFLKVFFQPIVSHKILNLISKKELEWDFSLSNWIYSWKYVVKNIIYDDNIDITTLILEKNKEYFKNPVYIDTIYIKVFPDIDTFSKNKDWINIFNDKNNIVWKNMSRFSFNEYTLPQHTNLFTNIDKISNLNIRKIILDEINKDEIVKNIWDNKVKKVSDPFLSDIYIKDKAINLSLNKELVKEWFITKKELLSKYNKKIKIEEFKFNSNILGEANIKKISSEVEIKKEYREVKIENKKSEVIFSPSWVDKYNFVSRDEYILKWNTRKNTTDIFINDYKLKSFKAHSKTFSYKISKKDLTLKEWQNTYKIFFVINWKKIEIEEINFYYNKDKTLLKKEEEKILNSTIKVEIPKNNNTDISKVNNNIVSNKGDIEELLELKKQLQKIKLLDDNFYYNNNFEKYSLELYFTSWKDYYKKTAKYIKEKLEKKWIKIEIREIKPNDLNKLLKEWKRNYDLLLVWINLSYFKSDINIYYHSKIYSDKEKGWIKNPYNFSWYIWLDMDIPLEELKWSILSEDIIKLSEKKILEVIRRENLSKTLFTPLLYNLVDKNIKWYKLNKEIPEDMHRFESLNKSYVKKEKEINTDDKNFSWYIKFLFKILVWKEN